MTAEIGDSSAGPQDRAGKTSIGLLPSLITLGNLICGFAAIGFATFGQIHPEKLSKWWWGTDPFAVAGGLILFAMVFDALDGKVARMTNLTSEFGGQLDSLCDMVSFGVAPAYIVFLEATSRDLFSLSRYAWVCAALYAVCAALRLARFNVESEPGEEGTDYFQGLPTPAAAGVIASLAVFEWSIREVTLWAVRLMPFVAVVLGGLMISRIRYAHLLNLLFRERKTFRHLVVVVFVLSAVIAFWEHHEYFLLAGFGGYVVSGPAMLAWAAFRRNRKRG